MTLHEVKAILQIKDNTHDDYINAILPKVQDFVMHYCRRTTIPPSLQLGVAKIIQYEMSNSSLQSKKIGDISWNYRETYPENIMKILNAHKKVLIV